MLRDVADLDYAEIAEVLDDPGRDRQVPHRPRPEPARREPREPGHPRRTSNQGTAAHSTSTLTMNDEQQLLASAYLDGALTDEERARAEADPEVMAAVERLGELRRALAAVEPPDRARRDAAINAALEVFDAERRRGRSPTGHLARRPPVGPLADAGRRRGRRGGPRRRHPRHARRRRRRWRRQRRRWRGGRGRAATLPTRPRRRHRSRRPTAADRPADEDEPPRRPRRPRRPKRRGPSAAADTTGAPADHGDGELVVITSPEELTEFASAALFATTYADAEHATAAATDVRRGPGSVGWVRRRTSRTASTTPVEIFLVARGLMRCVPSTRRPARVDRHAPTRQSRGAIATASLLVSPAMAGNPLTDPNWAPDLADTVERLVGTVREKATKPVVHAARGVVFGVLAGILAVVAITLLLIAATRGLQALLDLAVGWSTAVYLSYFIVGGILCLAGLLLLTRRPPPDA